MFRVRDQTRALAERSITSVALVSSCLAQIAQHDGGEDGIGAFLDVDREGALLAAAESDHRRQTGKDRGPLDGVVVAVKDNLCQRNRPTTAGSRVLEGFLAPFDATCVSRLAAAGAVIVGKTNLDEFGMGSSTERSAFFPTKNPWDRRRTPGGSSGGAAAAVAAGFAGVGLGTDTGGSVRQPAAFCGVVGVKPTYGRISRHGVIAFASSLDQVGVVADDVDGAALVLSAIAGVDGHDETTSNQAMPPLTGSGVDGLKVGIPRHLWADGGVDETIVAAMQSSCARLVDAGAVLTEVTLPHAAHAVATYYVLATAEASSNLSRYDGIRFGPRRGGEGSLADLYEATRALFGAEVRRRILLGTFVLSAGFFDAYVDRAARVRRLIALDFQKAFADVDVMLLPTTPSLPFALGEKTADPLAMYLGDLFTLPASLAGLPAASVPVGTVTMGSSATGAATSLPVGLQVIGRPFDEETLFRAMRALAVNLVLPGEKT
jgi:aspartyl-tRNA(Asn)/glutamyl-tRNA(Gln) amidotransferase subunit A